MIRFCHRLVTAAESLATPTVVTGCERRYVNTVPDSVLEKTRRSKLGQIAHGPGVEYTEKRRRERQLKDLRSPAYQESIRDFKYVYPDFLPDPVYYFRDKLREKLERQDMIERRKRIDIPEFYVGSIMAVSCSDKYAPGKVNRFVGICTRRDGYMLKHTFTLRNVIDGQGVEIQYDLYNPTIQSIEVLKLEKRLDDNLTYLQDCPPQYSTIPFDMQPVKIPPGQTVPLNMIRVPLNKKPWRFRWDRKPLKGVIYPGNKRYEHEQYLQSHSEFKPYERWDVMKHYRETMHDDDFDEVNVDVNKLKREIHIKEQVTSSSTTIVKRRQIPKPSTSSSESTTSSTSTKE